jgi:CRP/FNR family cyclic AMP-dependent transcriptional regulator
MTSTAGTKFREDPLAYLPHKATQSFARGQSIYDALRPPNTLYLVLAGRVKTTITDEDGRQAISRFIPAEGLFGESCLIPGSLGEAATAEDDVTVMAWSRDEIERQIEHEPLLGLALVQYLLGKCVELQARVESAARHEVPARVMLALAHLGSEFGTPVADGALRVPSITQRSIAEYIGTSREVVTQQMNRLRRIGVVSYSRKHIDVYLHAIRDELRHKGIDMPRAHLPITSSTPSESRATAQG